MPLIEHKGIKDIDDRLTKAMFVGYSKKPDKGTPADRAAKLRSKFRKTMRSCADRSVDLCGTDNGRGSRRNVQLGFEIAQEAYPIMDVLFSTFDGSTGTPFFYTERSLEKVKTNLYHFEIAVEEIEDLLKVQEVMTT